MMTAPIKYDEQQYQQALAIVESFESQREELTVYFKLHGTALELVLKEKEKTPKRSKGRIINRLLTELHALRQKK